MRALLMGGQACVLYGAAEFSRDTDLAILASPANLRRLASALDDLQAEAIAVPPFLPEFLEAGHAVHFRCRHPEAARLRIDVMTKMRGVDPFPKLWARRWTVHLSDGLAVDVLSLPDLVRAKKTQRDKDWPMVRRLVEAHYFANRESPPAATVDFWLRELRTPSLLIDVALRWPRQRERMLEERPLLSFAAPAREAELAQALLEEELAERRADTLYWRPLRAELERLRHGDEPRN